MFVGFLLIVASIGIDFATRILDFRIQENEFQDPRRIMLASKDGIALVGVLLVGYFALTRAGVV